MPRKKATAAKTTTRTKKKSVEEQVILEAPEKQTFWSQYLRFGESYTSLVLGIIVVIIATVLLLSFVQNRQESFPQEEQVAVTEGEIDEEAMATKSASITITETPEATATPRTELTVTVQPTENPTNSPLPTATKTPEPTKAEKKEDKSDDKKIYTVKAGDNLWKIAEQIYQSGYNWVDIARANKLNDPGDIHVGNRFVLPDVKAKVATVKAGEKKGAEKGTVAMESKKITGDTYKIEAGDSLWDIAVRAYGDGYAWTKIADANKLTENPGLIHVNNTIKIPRK